MKTTYDFLTALYNMTNSVSTDQTRYDLTGVYIDAEKKQLVATDGHQLSIMPYNDMESVQITGSATIPADFIKKAKRAAKKIVAKIKISKEKTTIDLMGETMQCNNLEGTFPDYNAIIPKSNSNNTTLHFNADLLTKINKALGNTKGTGGVTLEFTDKLSPILIKQLSDDKPGMGVLMPMKSGEA